MIYKPLSGSGGRPWTSIKWKVSKSSTVNYTIDTSKIQTFLDSFSSIDDAIIVPISLFPSNPSGLENKYEFSLTLANFLGGESTSFVPLIQSLSQNIPNVFILGPSSFDIRVDESLLVIASGSVSGCSVSSILTFAYKLYRNNIYEPDIVSRSKNPRHFLLRPYELLAGETYQIQVTVTSETKDTAQYIAQVYILPGAVEAFISGALKRLVPIDRELVIYHTYFFKQSLY